MKMYRINDVSFGFSSRRGAYEDPGESHSIGFKYLCVRVKIYQLIPFDMWYGSESTSLFTETGRWTIELLDENDNLLISKKFVLTPPPAENYITVRSLTIHPYSDKQRLAVEYSDNHKLSQPKIYSTDGHDWLVSVDLLRNDPNDYDVDLYVNLWFPDNSKMILPRNTIEARFDAVANWGVKLDPDSPVPKGQWNVDLHLLKPDGDDALLKTQTIRMY